MNQEKYLVARQYLNAVSPKPDTSAITSNEIVGETYDLTIIIPCYNEEEYIEQCVNSVIGQRTRYKIKIVIVDDGSTDNSPYLLRQYENEPDVEIITQENRGFSGARNRGLERIDSKYIMFVDSDDYLTENSLEPMLDAAFSHKADIVEAQMINLVENQLMRDRLPFECTGEADNTELSGYVCGKLVRAELFKNVCFPENYWFEDTIMAYLIYPRCKKALKYNVDVYVYRRNPKGITATSQGNIRSVDTYWITELMLEEMKKLNIQMTQVIYEQLFEQIALNYIRTKSLDVNILVAIFMLTSEWISKLHEEFTTTQRFQSILEKALILQDFNLYKDACVILWNKMLTE